MTLAISGKLAGIHQILQENGFRLTAARQVILGALVQSGGHLTADGLADLVREESPRVGRMTVYRTLDLLCQLAVIRPVYQGSAAAHYILLDDGHHHHLVCSICGDVTEIEECVLDDVGDVLNVRYQFQVMGHLLEFYGLCVSCQAAESQ